jgi:hypothetical protein
MVRTSFKVHLGVLALGVAVPIAAFALEAGTRDVPAKEITVPTAFRPESISLMTLCFKDATSLISTRS